MENLVEIKVPRPEAKIIDLTQKLQVEAIVHPYAIVVSQACDLEQDYKATLGQTRDDKRLSHVLFCELFLESEIRAQGGLNSQLWKRVRQNQDERYHRLDAGLVTDMEAAIPELFADFKTIFSLRVELVYSLVYSGQASRKGSLPSPYLQDFTQRLCSFLGRVGTPSPEESEGRSSSAP